MGDVVEEEGAGRGRCCRRRVIVCYVQYKTGLDRFSRPMTAMGLLQTLVIYTSMIERWTIYLGCAVKTLVHNMNQVRRLFYSPRGLSALSKLIKCTDRFPELCAGMQIEYSNTFWPLSLPQPHPPPYSHFKQSRKSRIQDPLIRNDKRLRRCAHLFTQGLSRPNSHETQVSESSMTLEQAMLVELLQCQQFSDQQTQSI